MPVPVSTKVTSPIRYSDQHNETTSKINWDNTTIKNFKDNLFTEHKRENIERCVDLLEHVGSCTNTETCTEGEYCLRIKSVLAHYRNCSGTLMGKDCPICQQFTALCQIHNIHCKNGKNDCYVPTCENGIPKKDDKKEEGKMKYKDLINKRYVDHRLVAMELLKARRIQSADEKKQRIKQLIENHGVATLNVMKQLSKGKPCKCGNMKQGSEMHRLLAQRALGRPVYLRAKVIIKSLPLK